MWQLVFSGVTLCVILVSGPKPGVESTSVYQIGGKHAQLVAVENHPELGKNVSSAAQLRVTTPKGRYRIGEVISVQLALLNLSKEPMFFRRVGNVDFVSRDKSGRPVLVYPYGIIESRSTPQSYVLLENSQASIDSYRLLVGCDNRAFQEMTELFYGKSESKGVIDNHLVKWGRACLSINAPGTYHITFELNNRFVLVSSSNAPVFLTAVGAIRSQPLTITIVQS